jgi:hypothetical protein
MATNLVIGVLVLALVIRRQLRPRTVRSDRSPSTFLVIGAIGVAQLVDAWQQHQPTDVGIGLLALSLVFAVGFGVWRAVSVRLWRQDDQLWQQGSAITVVLWIAAVAVHVGVDLVGGISEPRHSAAATSVTTTLSASIVLYIALSLGVQRVVVARRAQLVGVGATSH